MPETTSHRPASSVDFDLHGYVGIRLLDATPADVARVVRQIGPLRSTLRREPDITVRFTDDIGDTAPMTYAGWRDGGFTDDHFYVLRGKDGVHARAGIPFEDVGGRCDIVCERALPAVPLLLAVINFTALAKGLLPLHASGFVHDGQGVVATGWAKGGKTETLLAFAEAGAEYVGDEWVYLTGDRAMVGVPEPIRLWGWHLRQLPRVWSGLSGSERARVRVLGMLTRAVAGLATVAGDSSVGSALRRAAPTLERQVYVQVPPERLFDSGRIRARGPVDRVVLVASHDRAEITTEPVAAEEVAARMLASLAEERAVFMAYYRQFRFAFPDRGSAVVEDAERIEHQLLTTALTGLDLVWVRHPYPLEISAMRQPVVDALALVAQP